MNRENIKSLKIARFIAPLVMISMAIGIAHAQSRPAWTVRLPKSNSSTYIYVCESAIAGSEREARNQAISRVFENTAMRIGVPFDSQKVIEAVQRGTDLDVISKQYNIPIYKVCEYPEHIGYNYRVYVLCQVAASGNVTPQFDYSFRGCNDDKRYSTGSALLSSALLPGLGQMGKRHYGEGIFTLLGEMALVGGAVSTYYIGKNKLEEMTSGTLSFNDYASAEKKYNTLRTTNGILWGAAAALYVFNLYRAATLHPNYKQTVYIEPSLIDTPTEMLPVIGLTLKF